MNDIDRLLHDAFDSVRVPGDIRPHLGDVRTRARRMHRRRSAGMVGAFAMLGAAGVGIQSVRHDTRTALTPGDSGVGVGLGNDATTDGPTTSIDCSLAIAPTAPIDIDTTPAPGLQAEWPTGTTIAYYVVQMGDTPSGVASMLGVSLEELRSWNTNNTVFDSFVVGGRIVVPAFPGNVVGETTIAMPEDPTTSWGGNGIYPAQCAPGPTIDTTAPSSTATVTTAPDATVTTVTYLGSGQPPTSLAG